MKNLENIVGTVINGDCIEVMKTIPETTIDLVVTSCPYNVKISYDIYDDNLNMDDYWEWTEKWLTETFRLLKDDGRIAVNIPLEVNVQERGGRVFFVSEFYQIMKKVGFKFFGIVDLEEESPHRSKTTAWGSWMSCKGPYIYNPKECVILAYKEYHIKKNKGESEWKGEVIDVEQEDGVIKKKTVYKEEDKKEFMELVFGQWKYLNDSRPLTKATFSMDIPSKAIKILTYKDDVVLDPFAGSGTSLVAAEILGRKWIGIELSKKYCDVIKERIQPFIETKKQQNFQFTE